MLHLEVQQLSDCQQWQDLEFGDICCHSAPIMSTTRLLHMCILSTEATHNRPVKSTVLLAGFHS